MFIDKSKFLLYKLGVTLEQREDQTYSIRNTLWAKPDNARLNVSARIWVFP